MAIRNPLRHNLTSAPTARPSAPQRRNRARILAGCLAILIGAWASVALFRAAGDRQDIVAVAQHVTAGDTLERADLRVVRIATTGEAVKTIPASQLGDLIGRRVATDLPTGAILAPDQVRPANWRPIDDSESIVAVLARAGTTPTGLRRGAPIQAVIRPAAGSTDTEPRAITGWILDASARPLNTGDRPLEIVIPTDYAADVSAAAAEGLVTIIAGAPN